MANRSRLASAALVVAALVAAALAAAGKAAAQPAGDVFASSGRSCGYPGYRFDMDRVVAAARGYPNGRIYILTPQEKARLQQQLLAWNSGGGAPLREMAPCFNCSPQYEACIVYERGGDVFAGDGGTPPGPGGGDDFGSSGGPPAPGADSDACRKNPQSYTCLYGHPGKAVAQPGKPTPGKPRPGDCVEPGGGSSAGSSAYDPKRINAAWKRAWMPKWGQAMNAANLRIKAGIAALGAELRRTPGADPYLVAAWAYDLEVAPDGTIKPRLLLERDEGALVPQDWLQKQKYMQRAHSFANELARTKAPPFPAGSRWASIVRRVQFHTVDSTTLPATDAPAEPYAEAGGVLLPGVEARGKVLPPEGLTAKPLKLCP